MSHSHSAGGAPEPTPQTDQIGRILRWTIVAPAITGGLVAIPFTVTGVPIEAGTIAGLAVLVILGIGLTHALRPPRLWVGVSYLVAWVLVAGVTMTVLLRISS